MKTDLSISELEAAINRCKREQPFEDCVLPDDLKAMAGLYGQMIFFHHSSTSLVMLTPSLRLVIEQWLPADDAAAPASPGVCRYRQGGNQDDFCEACQ